MVRFGFEAHDTGEPKSEDAPDNLFAPLPHIDTARDGFDRSALRHSLYGALSRALAPERLPLVGAGLTLLAHGRRALR
jgi:hypothetical protein